MPATVTDWQKYFMRLYGEVNKSRADFEIFTRLSEHIGLLSKVSTIRTGAARFRNQNGQSGTKGTAQYFLARSISWYFALANSCEVSVVDSVWTKYPGICPYCLSNKCRCHELDDLPPYEPHHVGNVASSNKTTFLPESYSFDRWRRHFENIYRINRKFPLEQIFLHLFEELAEVAEALRLPRKDHIQDELADVFAWLMAIISGLRLDNGVVQASLLSQYENGCSLCQKMPCSCEVPPGPRIVGMREPAVSGEAKRIEEFTLRQQPILEQTTTPIDQIYKSPYREGFEREIIDDQITSATESNAKFREEAASVKQGAYELPGEYKRRVAVLGNFDTYPLMQSIAKKVSARGFIAVTSSAIFEKNTQTQEIVKTPLRHYSEMGMNEFLKTFILGCRYVINFCTNDAGNIIESEWCFQNHKTTLGIALSKDLTTTPCCEYYNLENEVYGTCKYSGTEGAMFCRRQTCPFTQHKMSKMVLDHYVGREGRTMVIIDDLDMLDQVIDKFLPALNK